MFNGKWNTALLCLDEESICLFWDYFKSIWPGLVCHTACTVSAIALPPCADLNLIDSILILHRRFEGRLKI